MRESSWLYLGNPFETQTRSSFKKMSMMAKDHVDKLTAAAPSHVLFQTMLDRTKPVYNSYSTKYVEMYTNSGTYEGNTQIVRVLFEELTKKHVKRWDIEIQMEYMDGTAEYKMIFPDGKTAFQRGGYEARIREVQALSERMKDFPVLEEIRTKVEAFALKLKEARTKQQGYEYNSSRISDELESLRIALAKIMHANFGLLIDHYVENTEHVLNFYDIQYLRTYRKKEDDTEEVIEEPIILLDSPSSDYENDGTD